MKRQLYKYLISTSLLLASFPSWSVPLLVFGNQAINGTTVTDRPALAGTVLEDVSSSYSFSSPDGHFLTGNIQNRVVRSIDGTLDFYWRIMPVNGNASVSAFRVVGFESFALDADWRSDGLGTASPDEVRYFGPGSGSVNFIFNNSPVSPDNTAGSMFFFLDTDALNYDNSGRFDLLCPDHNRCISELYNTFAPSAVPLPAAAWLFGTGLISLIGVNRRKHQNSSIA